MVLFKTDLPSYNSLKIVDDWTEQLDSGGQINVIYADFAKAFDTVPHLLFTTLPWRLSHTIEQRS